MEIQPVSVVLFFSSTILASLAAHSWRHRAIPLGRYFFCLLISSTIYCFGYGMELSSLTLPKILLWSRIQYFGIPYIAAFYLLVAVAYVGKMSKIKVPFLIFLLALPSITLILHLTMKSHGMMYVNPQIDYSGPLPVLTFDQGLWYLVQAVYSNLCIIIANVLYIIFLIRGSPAYRAQIGIMVIGGAVTWISQIIYLSRIIPYNIDITPFASGITGVIFTIGVLKYKLYGLAPIAREQVFENINEGILVLDLEEKLIDYNRSAAGILPSLDRTSIGKKIIDVLSEYPMLTPLFRDSNINSSSVEFSLGGEQSHKDYKASREELKPGKKYTQGSLLVINDISEHKQLLSSLEKFATTDSLTGIFNRRHFLELAEREILRMKRSKKPFAVILYDLDHFKRVNDSYGHAAGDTILIGTASIVQDMVREIDIFGRYGGEEFIIVLSGTSPSDAMIIADRIRKTFEEAKTALDGESIVVTASFGVSGREKGKLKSLKDYIETADAALYEAKNSGRNRVVLRNP